MKTKSLTMAIGAIVLTGSLSANVIQAVTYRNLTRAVWLDPQKDLVVHSARDMQALAYWHPDRWLWHPEPRGISRQQRQWAPVFPGHDELGDLIQQHAVGGTIFDMSVSLLSWYTQNRLSLAQAYFPAISKDKIIFCDENSAAFRSILMRAGIQSRVVNFQFDDGDGGESHTALEIWLPEQRRWVYFDVHYNAYANASVMDVAADFRKLTILDQANTDILRETFTRGMHNLAFESFGPRQRIRYVQQ